MKRFLQITLSILGAAVIFGACEQSNVAITVPIGEQTFSFDLLSSRGPWESNGRASATKNEDIYYPFIGSYNLTLNDPMFEDVWQYIGENIDFRIKSIKLKVIPAEGLENLHLKNVKFSFAGINRPAYEIDEININDEFEDEVLLDYFRDAFKVLQINQDINVDVSGSSNLVSAGKIGTIEITVDVSAKVFVAKE